MEVKYDLLKELLLSELVGRELEDENKNQNRTDPKGVAGTRH